jgi:uncharacterized Rossmann fold enzyme
MKFRDWEPVYVEILEYFCFSREEDEEAARILAGLAVRDDLPVLRRMAEGKTVTVCGNAPSLRTELDDIAGTVFAADNAAEVLYSAGVRPDAVFTDLDGAVDSFFSMNREGTVMVVHAHGDNIPLLRRWVPRFEGPLVATTQAAPFGAVYNFGGFTDGDRAVYAADELSAASVRLAGFDLDDTSVDRMKRAKLAWARRLLAMIGYEQ